MSDVVSNETTALKFGDRVEFIGSGLPVPEEDRVFGTLVDPDDSELNAEHPGFQGMVKIIRLILSTPEVFWVMPDQEMLVGENEDLRGVPFYAQRAELVKVDG